MSSYDVFEVANCRIRQEQSPKNANSDKSVHQNQKQTTPLKNSGNSTQNKKKLHLIWSPDDRVMAV